MKCTNIISGGRTARKTTAPFDHAEISEERLRNYIDIFVADEGEFQFVSPERSVRSPDW